jgi:hypothetical protein
LPRRGARSAGFVLLVLLFLVIVGRWDANRDVQNQRARITELYRLAREHPIPDGWRIAPPYRCLFYRNATDPFAFEFCFDPLGRLVEAIDRRAGDPEVASLRSQWSKASIRVDSAALDSVLRQMRAYDPRSPNGAAIRPGPWYGVKLPPPRIPRGSGLPSPRA